MSRSVSYAHSLSRAAGTETGTSTPSTARMNSIMSLYSARSLAMDLVTEVAEQNWMLR